VRPCVIRSAVVGASARKAIGYVSVLEPDQ